MRKYQRAMIMSFKKYQQDDMKNIEEKEKRQAEIIEEHLL